MFVHAVVLGLFGDEAILYAFSLLVFIAPNPHAYLVH